ncbi:MAG TPA: hypothetical protein VGW37_09200 [Terriglobia bacterium]|nr:hypothetical protein [Terriglobia bacterium]
MKCDHDGNIYVAYSGTSLPPDSGALPVRKIPADSTGRVIEYTLQNLPDYQSAEQLNYDVNPWGTVYYLLRAYRHWPRLKGEQPDLVAAKFKDDGTLDSVTKLESTGEGYLQANLFAVFPYGGFLVTGTLVEDPAQHLARPFTGIYDRTGRFVREVELTGDVTAGSGAKDVGENGPAKQDASAAKDVDWMLAVSEGNMIGAPDGNVYLLRASNPPRLYAISAGGEVVKALTLRFDAAGLTPIGMSLAGENQALIEFGHYPTGKPSEDSKYHTVLSLVNLASGDVTGTFEAPEDVLPSACATSNDEFLFLGTSKQGTLDVVKFADSAN